MKRRTCAWSTATTRRRTCSSATACGSSLRGCALRRPGVRRGRHAQPPAAEVVHVPRSSPELELSANCFWKAYRTAVPAELAPELPYLLGHVGVLMVARVDGKSPAEYLARPSRRSRARPARVCCSNPRRRCAPRSGCQAGAGVTPTIAAVVAREILDPADARPSRSIWRSATGPSCRECSLGASTGRHESHELRDNDPSRSTATACLARREHPRHDRASGRRPKPVRPGAARRPAHRADGAMTARAGRKRAARGVDPQRSAQQPRRAGSS